MKKSLKLRAVVSPTPAIIAAAYDGNGKTDACTLAFYTPTRSSSPTVRSAVRLPMHSKRGCASGTIGRRRTDGHGGL